MLSKVIHLVFKFLFVVFLTITSSQAQEANSVARCRLIADSSMRLACYDKLTPPPSSITTQKYKAIRLADFRVDMDELRGHHVEVPGILKLVNGDVGHLMSSTRNFELYVSVDTKHLAREFRLLLVTKCASGCSVVVRGRVGTIGAGFPIGIIADSFETIQ